MHPWILGRVAFAAVVFFVIASTSLLRAQTVQVPSTSNIYGAGHSAPPAGGSGVGELPPEYDFGFTAGSNLSLTFSSVSGNVILNVGSGNNSNDPDGVGAGSPNSNTTSVGGLSGISAPNAGYLVGVFETNAEPVDPAPLSLNFSVIGTNFTSLSPALNQVFFIGDGLTGDGTGAQQQFQIPAGATRLFLGLADAPGYSGSPGGYGDNTGQFTATFAIVPEPSMIGLMAVGAILMGLRVRRSRR